MFEVWCLVCVVVCCVLCGGVRLLFFVSCQLFVVRCVLLFFGGWCFCLFVV